MHVVGSTLGGRNKINMKKDKEILEEVLTHLRTMRDTWKEVMRLAPAQK